MINSEKLEQSGDYSTYMSDLFDYYDIGYDMEDKIEKDDFDDFMLNAFVDACKFDLCYLYISAHGRESLPGIALYQGPDYDPNSYLTPGRLRSEIGNYDGIFIVFLETCYSGNFILDSTSTTDVEITKAELNAEAMDFIQSFVNELVGIQQDDSGVSVLNYNLTGSERIKVLGESRYFETSQADSSAATYAWCKGSGRGSIPENMMRLYADEDFGNSDGRTSIEELYDYSYYMMNINPATSLPVRYPENDNYIIFENDF